LVIVLTSCSHGLAQSVALSLSSGSGSPGASVVLNISLNATGNLPNSTEWTLNYSPTDFTSASFAAGSGAVNKSLSCSNGSGTATCLVWGLNSTTIPNNVLASVTLALADSTADTSSSVQLTNGFSADSAGAGISTSASGGTVTILQTPVLSGLSCNPTSLTPSAGSTCTVAVTSAALSGGATIGLSASPALANVPATVTIPQGSTSVTFSVTAGTVSTPTPVTLTASYSGVNATFGVTVNPALAVVASATYAGLDTTTQGTWTGKYGADGYIVANDATNPPAYATVSLTGDSLYTWAASTTTVSALQASSGSSKRMASCYYSTTHFTMNLNLTDGNAHQIALYLLDWSGTARSETISILDAVSNAVLYTGSFSSFHNGEYAVWNVQGHVLIQVTKTGGTNAVVSGIFFD
jgi:hypothetical protein